MPSQPKTPRARPARRAAGKSELRRIKNILVPVDFSEASLRALAAAGQWAKQLGAAIHMVYVIEPPTVPQWGYVFLALREDKLRSEAKRQMELLRREGPQDVPLTFEILSGAGAEHEVCELAAQRRSDLDRDGQPWMGKNQTRAARQHSGTNRPPRALSGAGC